MIFFQRFVCFDRMSFWFSALACFIAGLLESFSYSPYGLLWLQIIGLVFLYNFYRRGAAMSCGKRFFYSFFLGLCYGLGKFVHGIYWIHEAFLVEGGIFVWFGYFAIPLLALALSLMMACALGLCSLLSSWRRLPDFFEWLNVVLVLTLFEWVRAHFLTGFPWHMPVNALVANENLLQLLSFSGAHGGNFLIYATIISQHYLLDFWHERKLWQIALPLMAMIFWIGVYIYGDMRLSSVELFSLESSKTSALQVRIVQANIDQRQKWQKGNLDKVWQKTRQLSLKKTTAFPDGIEEIDFLIWPESQLPVLYEESKPYFAAVRDILSPRSVLAAGQIIIEDTKDKDISKLARYNSIVFVNKADGLIDRYNKVLLVPFSELIPFSDLLRFLGLGFIVDWSSGGFTAGLSSSLSDFPTKGVFLIPTICYEAIFPDYIYDTSSTKEAGKAVFLLNVSNDAWFGTSIGPSQLFAVSQLRAVENGVPVLRASNTGISGVIDAYGRVVRKIGLNEEGVIDIRLNRQNPSTLASYYADNFVLVMLVLFMLMTAMRFFIRLR